MTSIPPLHPQQRAPLRVAVGIPTAGRREQMSRTLRQLAMQHRTPDGVFISPATPADFDEADASTLPCPVQVLHGQQGLTRQRNQILASAHGFDVLVYFDDDFYPQPDYLQQVVALFESQPDIVVATNQPQADGAVGPGLSHDEALRALERHAGESTTLSTVPTYGGYGCNMAVRLAPVVEHGLRFDERLPLYGWLEDIDFTRHLAPHGRIVKCAALRGVHLGTKRGRTSGLRLGYSQVANPVYMLRKGSLSFDYAMRQLGRNVIKNVARAAWPEPWVDRRGRLKGNFIALVDLLRGRIEPDRIQDLK